METTFYIDPKFLLWTKLFESSMKKYLILKYPENLKEESSSRKVLGYKTAAAVARRCTVKKMFLKILQNSLENTYARASILIRMPAALFKKGGSGAGFFLRIFWNF